MFKPKEAVCLDFSKHQVLPPLHYLGPPCPSLGTPPTHLDHTTTHLALPLPGTPRLPDNAPASVENPHSPVSGLPAGCPVGALKSLQEELRGGPRTPGPREPRSGRGLVCPRWSPGFSSAERLLCAGSGWG